MQGISAMRPMNPRPVTTGKEGKTTSWKGWKAARTPEQVEWDNRLAQFHSLQAAKDHFYSDWDEAERWQASRRQVAEDCSNSDWDKTERRKTESRQEATAVGSVALKDLLYRRRRATTSTSSMPIIRSVCLHIA